MSGIRAALFDIHRASRFLSVGILGACIDLLVSSTLVIGVDVQPELAKFVGAECAIVVMFVLNDRWTFVGSRTRGLRSGIQRLIKSNLVRSGGIAVQIVVVFVLTRVGSTVYVGGVDIWPVATMPIAIACGFVLNYVGETLLTWRVAARM